MKCASQFGGMTLLSETHWGTASHLSATSGHLLVRDWGLTCPCSNIFSCPPSSPLPFSPPLLMSIYKLGIWSPSSTESWQERFWFPQCKKLWWDLRWHSCAVMPSGPRLLLSFCFTFSLCGFLSSCSLAVVAADITFASKAEKESKSFPRMPSPSSRP